MDKKHLVFVALSGALALGLAGCGKHEGPYSGHSEKFFYKHMHTAATAKDRVVTGQMDWCKKHDSSFHDKTCQALVQAVSQRELHTFLAPPAPGQNAMGSGKDINLGNTAQFNPLAK